MERFLEEFYQRAGLGPNASDDEKILAWERMGTGIAGLSIPEVKDCDCSKILKIYESVGYVSLNGKIPKSMSRIEESDFR